MQMQEYLKLQVFQCMLVRVPPDFISNPAAAQPEPEPEPDLAETRFRATKQSTWPTGTLLRTYKILNMQKNKK